MYTANINDFKIKRDELVRQAEKYRLIQAIKKGHSPSSPLARAFRKTISQLLSI
jgi:hypothetical protein